VIDENLSSEFKGRQKLLSLPYLKIGFFFYKNTLESRKNTLCCVNMLRILQNDPWILEVLKDPSGVPIRISKRHKDP
jgi:hypothetical protein